MIQNTTHTCCETKGHAIQCSIETKLQLITALPQHTRYGTIHRHTNRSLALQ